MGENIKTKASFKYNYNKVFIAAGIFRHQELS